MVVSAIKYAVRHGVSMYCEQSNFCGTVLPCANVVLRGRGGTYDDRALIHMDTTLGVDYRCQDHIEAGVDACSGANRAS